MIKVKPLTHCCQDCLMRYKKTCAIKDPHFTEQPLEKVNTCPNWQN